MAAVPRWQAKWLLALAFPLSAGAEPRTINIVGCEPAAYAQKVREKAYHWRERFERFWCRGTERTALYPIEVHCGKGAGALPHLTTYRLILNEVIETARIDIDPSVSGILDHGLAHGMGHAVLPSCLAPHVPLMTLPAWILEGMAHSLVATLDEDARREFGRVGAPPLEGLTNFLFDGRRDLGFYTQAALLVRFLVDNGGGADRFRRFVAELGFEGVSASQNTAQLGQYGRMLRKHYGMTLTEVETAFRAAVARLLAPEPRRTAGDR